MLNITAFPGRYIQGDNALKTLGEQIAQYADKGLLLCDPFVVEQNLFGVEADIKKYADIAVETFRGECCDDEINRIAKRIGDWNCGLVVGIGGGKTLDTAKAVADKVKIPVIIVPTAASSDAPCSSGSVVYNNDGSFNRVIHPPKSPDIVLVDTRVIVNAPVRLLVAGMGDALATWFEAESVKAKYEKNVVGGMGSLAAYSLSKLCFDILMEFGALAKKACEAKVLTPGFEHVVEANILLSGLGFESGGLASAHAVYNGFTVLEATHSYLHGEQVAFGVLVSMFLTDKPRAMIEQVYTFCKSVGLPLCLADIGLQNASQDQVTAVAEATCQTGANIYHEPTPISVQKVKDAIMMADVYGKIWK